MKLRIIRQHFNLVEITLAMAVIGMGVAGVMALFQFGMQNSRDAVGDNYAADTAEVFISYITQMAAVDVAWDPSPSITGLDDTKVPIATDAKPDNAGAGDDTATAWTPIAGTNISFAAATPGLYRVTQGSASITDFDSSVRVWQTEISTASTPLNEGIYIGGNQDITDRSYGVGINVEVSWPRAKPYAGREKRYYYFEVFNPNKI